MRKVRSLSFRPCALRVSGMMLSIDAASQPQRYRGPIGSTVRLQRTVRSPFQLQTESPQRSGRSIRAINCREQMQQRVQGRTILCPPQ